jgi:hypothetical protein
MAPPPPKKHRVHAPIVIDSDGDDPPSSGPTQTLAEDTVVPSTSEVDLKVNKQATLKDMSWQEWLPGAQEAHRKQTIELHHAEAESKIHRIQVEKAAKLQRRREPTAARLRRFREKRKAATEDEEEELSDNNNTHVVLMRGADATAHQRQVDVAGIYRVETQGWRKARNGSKNGTVQKMTAAVNWFHPFLFGPIDKQTRLTGWSPSHTARNLHKQSALHKGLQKCTISRWRVKGKDEWTPATLDKITAGKAITASGRTGILTPYPDITIKIKETLTRLRTAGAIVNVSIARAVLLAEIESQHPQLLEKFKASEKFVRTFFGQCYGLDTAKGNPSVPAHPRRCTHSSEEDVFPFALRDIDWENSARGLRILMVDNYCVSHTSTSSLMQTKQGVTSCLPARIPSRLMLWRKMRNVPPQ